MNLNASTKKLKERYKKRYKKTKVIRDARRILLIKKMGAKCKMCGYDRNIANLCFHHVDPNQKKFAITSGNLQKKWEVLIEEVKKCQLVCFHCHNDIHHPNGLNWKKGGQV